VWWFARDSLFVLPRERPALWCLILVLYPVASVAPQAILYRAFLLHRYGPLAGSNRAGIVVSAAAFAWMHVLFGNVLAPLLTLPAGLLFAWRYVRTGSLAVSVLEHTLYGCTIFTVGLGTFFHAR
jgi:membrane protease YdiL (CAAX protease family)